MRRIRIAVVCFALAAGVLAGTSASIASAEEPLPPAGCSANVICVYTSANYENPFFDAFCSSSVVSGLEGNRHSATNRCGNKTDWLRESGTVIACMNPGGDRPNPGAFNEVFVAAEFGAFC